MAEVFLARHRGPGGYEKRLVIKKILAHLAADPRFLRMFFEEAKLHVSLSHGNLVPIFDFGRVGNDYFLAMEYVDGRDLSALLQAQRDRDEPLPAMCVAFLGQEICRALGYVHAHGLVHRDITPRNVLISVDGEVKLADFGVAQRGDATGVEVRGTVAYMAPDQARGGVVDARADLYALGLILAEASTGARVRAPHDDASQGLAAASKATRVEIDGPFAAVVARATEPDPAARFADAAEMAAALENVERALQGSRAQATHALAERIKSLTESPAASDADVAPSNDGPATYFRDGETQASIIDEIVAAPQPARRALPRLGFVVSLAVLTITGVALVRRMMQAPETKPVVVHVEPVAKPVAKPVAPVVVAPASPEPAREVERAHHERPHAIPVARPAAKLNIRCSPWCVVDVDGVRNGEDGRSHSLAIAAGRHDITIRRLDDVQHRTVDLAPGDESELELRFE